MTLFFIVNYVLGKKGSQLIYIENFKQNKKLIDVLRSLT